MHAENYDDLEKIETPITFGRDIRRHKAVQKERLDRLGRLAAKLKNLENDPGKSEKSER